MVRADVAGRKIARAAARLDEVEALIARPVEQFLADVRARDLASFYLFLAIQECIDLAAHWVADSGWAPPEDAGSTFDILTEQHAIPRDLAEVMKEPRDCATASLMATRSSIMPASTRSSGREPRPSAGS